MRHILNIVKKELDKIFTNPRLIFSTFILPGLMIFLIYSTMGNIASVEVDKATTSTSVIYLINSPECFEEIIDAYNEVYPVGNPNNINCKFIRYQEEEITSEELQNDLKEAKCHAYVVFEKGFEEILQNRLNDQSLPLPVVDCYMLSTSSISSVAYQKVSTLLKALKDYKIKETYGDITIINDQTFDLSTKEEQSNLILGMILPMFLMIFVFAGGLSVGADAIAGEKERGTIATIMMAPINKNEIVIGKVASSIIITIISAIGSFIGVALSLPSTEDIFGGADMSMFTTGTFVGLFLLIMSTALIAVTLFLIASTLAKSVKEATAYSMPFYIISMVISVSTMYMETLPKEITGYLIPIYNLSLGLKGILIGDLTIPYLLLIIGSNFVYFILGVLLMVKLFKSEKLMFAK
ncbi:MAG: ABC transporter permease [Bacilli bacterium]|nr:ABC transporter permease [Bacilli bacterium]